MDLDSEELEATRNKSADKMFEDLGYELITEEDFKVQSNEFITKIHKLKEEIDDLQVKNNYRNTNNHHLEQLLDNIRKKAQEKLQYENVDIDSLIWEFLEKIEVYKMNDKDFIKLRVILNTGKTYGINLNTQKHPFGTNYTYD